MTKKAQNKYKGAHLLISSAITGALYFVFKSGILGIDLEGDLSFFFTTFLLAVTVIFFFIGIIGLIRLLFAKNKRVAVKILLGIFILVAAATSVLASKHTDKKTVDGIAVIQGSMTEIAASKLLGDEVVKNGQGAEALEDARLEALIAVVSLDIADIPRALGDYKESVVEWGNEVGGLASTQNEPASIFKSAHASTHDSWVNIPESPRSFTIKLTRKRASDAFEKSIVNVASTHEFGIRAIRASDRTTMRYVASRLSASNHFLQNLSSSTGTNICGRGGCIGEATKIVPGIWRTAHGYAVGDSPLGSTGATDPWNDSWEDTPDFIKPDSAGSIEGAGISQGTPDEYEHPPAVKAFFSNCEAMGGVANGTGGVQTRLPTTESGWSCWLDVAGGKCWEKMTYSGALYKGGSLGANCPEQGLLPRLWSDRLTEITSLLPFQQASWDGTYSTRFDLSCNIRAPELAQSLADSAVGDFVVRNNRIVSEGGSAVAIDSSGRAVDNYDFGIGQMTITYQFSRSNNAQALVNGTFQLNAYSSPTNISCTGTFSGSN